MVQAEQPRSEAVFRAWRVRSPAITVHKQACAAVFPAHSFSMLPDEQPSPEQVEIMRAIPGEQRLRLAERLYWSARKMKAAGLRAQHPDWPEERVGAEVSRIFADGRT